MEDAPITIEEIKLQDAICKAVAANPKKSVVDIYNTIYQTAKCHDLKDLEHVFALIRTNKSIFRQD